MRKLFIVANLKSNQTKSEAGEWLESFKNFKEIKENLVDKEVIICPSFTLLSFYYSYILDNDISVKLGAQNVSPFEEGAYTGEVNARQIKEFADYVLVGHSERRSNFKEDDETLSKKVEVCLKHGLKPIFLVQDKNTLVPQGIELISYEPVFAIGTGNPDTAENANEISGVIKQKGMCEVLYGGSVTSENVKNFTKEQNISGVLVGGASLDAKKFIEIIQNA